MGVRYHQFAFPKSVKLTGDITEGIPDREAKVFMELLISEGAQVLASYDHVSWKEYAAVTKNSYGKGHGYYIGCMMDEELLGRILEDALQVAGAERVVKECFPVIVRKGMNRRGRRLWYYLNYSAKEKSAVYHGNSGHDIMTGNAMAEYEQFSIPAWDVRIVEEDE